MKTNILIVSCFFLSATLHAGGLAEWHPTYPHPNPYGIPGFPNWGSVAVSRITPSANLQLTPPFDTANWGIGPSVDLSRYIEFSIWLTNPVQLIAPIGIDASIRYDYAPDELFNWEVRSSLDNFSAPIDKISQNVDSDHLCLNLMKMGAFEATSPVTFRIYGYSSEGTNIGVDFGFFYMPGTPVSVPEPRSIALSVLALLLIAPLLVQATQRWNFSAHHGSGSLASEPEV